MNNKYVSVLALLMSLSVIPILSYLSSGVVRGIHFSRSTLVNLERRMSVDLPSFLPRRNLFR